MKFQNQITALVLTIFSLSAAAIECPKEQLRIESDDLQTLWQHGEVERTCQSIWENERKEHERENTRKQWVEDTALKLWLDVKENIKKGQQRWGIADPRSVYGDQPSL